MNRQHIAILSSCILLWTTQASCSSSTDALDPNSLNWTSEHVDLDMATIKTSGNLHIHLRESGKLYFYMMDLEDGFGQHGGMGRGYSGSGALDNIYFGFKDAGEPHIIELSSWISPILGRLSTEYLQEEQTLNMAGRFIPNDKSELLPQGEGLPFELSIRLTPEFFEEAAKTSSQ
jgi:hypothetical protein